MQDQSPITGKLLALAAIIVIIAGLKLSAELIAPILFAFTLTVLIWPLLVWLKKKGVPRGLAITIVAAAAILSMISLIIALTSSLHQLSRNIPYYSDMLDKQLEPLVGSISGLNVADSLKVVGLSGSSLAQAGIRFASGFATSVISVVTFLLMLLFMIIASEEVVKRYNELMGKDHSFASDFAQWSKNIQVQYRVQTMSNLLTGVVIMVLFFALGVDYAVLWGVLAFLLSYIPNIGLVIASIPPVLLTLILHGWPTAIFAAAFIIVLNLIMDNVVTPRFIGAALKLPAVYIFISFLVCSYIFGILGAFLSLPLFLALQQLLLLDPRTRFIGQMISSAPSKGGKAKR